MALTPSGIAVDPRGQTATVTITEPSGATATVYLAKDGSSVRSMPAAINSRTVFYLLSEMNYTLSVTVNGVERANGAGGTLTVDLSAGGVFSVNIPVLDTDEQANLAGAYVTVVEHGATAGTARPAGAVRVFWRGSVQPTNAVQYDRWLNTSASPYTESVFDGSTWTALGFGTGASLSTAQNWTARQRFTVMPQIFGASGDTVPIFARSVGDGLVNGAINVVHDSNVADVIHMVTGPNTGPSRTVTDAVLNGTTTITSATAAFTTGPVANGIGTDIGKTVTGTGIPAGTVIASVTNATTAVLSQAATTTASGVTLALGSGPNSNGCVIAIGVDNGGTGIITRNKSTGIALHVDQLDTVSSASAYGAFMYHESHVAPFSYWTLTSTATQPMIRMAPNIAGTAPAGATWFDIHDNDTTYSAGYINADNGKIDWRRSISATAPAASYTPLLRVADEVATYPTEAYLKAKTTADAGLYVYRNTTGSGANSQAWSFRATMDSASSNIMKLQMGSAPADRGSETLKTLIALTGNTGTTGGLGFYGATPVAQPSSTTDLRAALVNLGLLAGGGATPLDLNGGTLTAGGLALTAANVVLDNTQSFRVKETGGTQRSIGSVTAGNILTLGDNSSSNTYVQGTQILITPGGVSKIGFSSAGIAPADGVPFVLGSTTGNKIGSAATQKLAFYGATPVVQPASTPAAATDLATALTLVNDLRSKLLTLGLAA